MAYTLDAKKIKELQKNDSTPSISMYLPMIHGHNGTDSNRIEFKNALRVAKRMSESKSVPSTARRTRKWQKHARSLASDIHLWSSQDNGLAVFINNKESMAFPVTQKFERRIFVGCRYITEPLESFISGINKPYWILALSQKSTRLFKAKGDVVDAKGIKIIPKSLKEALRLDEIDNKLQTHMVGRGGSKHAEAFHGHGKYKDLHKKLIDRYLRMVAASVDTILKPSKDPLIIIGTAPLLARYRKIDKNKKLTTTNVYANVDHLSGQQIRRLILDAK